MSNKYAAISLGLLSLFVLSVSLFEPKLLADNSFLDDFIGSQILSLLAIILTITLASVANIHLALNRIIESKFKDDFLLGYKGAEPVRKEINSNAWMLFWSFLICILLLLINGQFGKITYVQSFVYGICLIILVLNVCVLYEIYKSVYALIGIPTGTISEQNHSYPEGSPTK